MIKLMFNLAFMLALYYVYDCSAYKYLFSGYWSGLLQEANLACVREQYKKLLDKNLQDVIRIKDMVELLMKEYGTRLEVDLNDSWVFKAFLFIWFLCLLGRYLFDKFKAKIWELLTILRLHNFFSTLFASRTGHMRTTINNHLNDINNYQVQEIAVPALVSEQIIDSAAYIETITKLAESHDNRLKYTAFSVELIKCSAKSTSEFLSLVESHSRYERFIYRGIEENNNTLNKFNNAILDQLDSYVSLVGEINKTEGLNQVNVNVAINAIVENYFVMRVAQTNLLNSAIKANTALLGLRNGHWDAIVDELERSHVALATFIEISKKEVAALLGSDLGKSLSDLIVVPSRFNDFIKKSNESSIPVPFLFKKPDFTFDGGSIACLKELNLIDSAAPLIGYSEHKHEEAPVLNGIGDRDEEISGVGVKHEEALILNGIGDRDEDISVSSKVISGVGVKHEEAIILNGIGDRDEEISVSSRNNSVRGAALGIPKGNPLDPSVIVATHRQAYFSDVSDIFRPNLGVNVGGLGPGQSLADFGQSLADLQASLKGLEAALPHKQVLSENSSYLDDVS